MLRSPLLQRGELGGQVVDKRGDVGHEVAGDLHAVGRNPLARDGLDLVGYGKDIDQGVAHSIRVVCRAHQRAHLDRLAGHRGQHAPARLARERGVRGPGAVV